MKQYRIPLYIGKKRDADTLDNVLNTLKEDSYIRCGFTSEPGAIFSTKQYSNHDRAILCPGILPVKLVAVEINENGLHTAVIEPTNLYSDIEDSMLRDVVALPYITRFKDKDENIVKFCSGIEIIPSYQMVVLEADVFPTPKCHHDYEVTPNISNELISVVNGELSKNAVGMMLTHRYYVAQHVKSGRKFVRIGEYDDVKFLNGDKVVTSRLQWLYPDYPVICEILHTEQFPDGIISHETISMNEFFRDNLTGGYKLLPETFNPRIERNDLAGMKDEICEE